MLLDENYSLNGNFYKKKAEDGRQAFTRKTYGRHRERVRVFCERKRAAAVMASALGHAFEEEEWFFRFMELTDPILCISAAILRSLSSAALTRRNGRKIRAQDHNMPISRTL